MENQESNQKDRILENEIELMKSIPALAKIEEKDIIYNSIFILQIAFAGRGFHFTVSL